MAKFDPGRLSKLDWAVIGGGGLALISLFLPWYGASIAGFSISVSGWRTTYGWLGGLLIVAAGVYLVLSRSGVNLPSMPVTATVVVLGAAVLGTVIVIIRWATLPSGHAGFAGIGLSYGPRVGIYLTILSGLVQAGAAVALFRASGEKLPGTQKGTASS